MSRKTARSALTTIAVLATMAVVVNTAPAGEVMTFHPTPDGFAGPLPEGARARPIDRQVASTSKLKLRRVACAGPVAPGTACFVAAR